MTTASIERTSVPSRRGSGLSRKLAQLRNLWVSVVAVAIGTVLLSTCLFFGDSVTRAIQADAREMVGDADLVLESTSPRKQVDPSTIRELESTGTTTSIQIFKNEIVTSASSDDVNSLMIETRPEGTDYTLASGALPSQPGEVVISQLAADKFHLTPGTQWKVLDYNEQEKRVRITGIVTNDSPGVATAPLPMMYASLDNSVAISGTDGVEYAFVSGDDENALQNSVQNLREVQDGSIGVLTAQEAITQISTENSHGISAISKLISLFGLVGVVVASILISNIFQTYALRRQKEFALLRSLGASKRQVSAMVVGEGLLVGVVGSIIGLVVGAFVVRIATSMAGTILGMKTLFAISLSSALLVIVVGIVGAVLASLGPALAANKVSPALMVGGIGEALATRAPSIVRRLVAVVALILGVGLCVFSVASVNIAITVLGAFFVVVGVVMGLSPVLYFIGKRLSGRLSASEHVSYQIGSENIRRNSKRSATSALALAVGASLAALCAVGFSTGVKTLLDFADHEAPVDATLSGQVEPYMVTEVEALPGVNSVRTLPFATVDAQMNDGAPKQLEIASYTQEVAPVLRNFDDISALQDGEILMNQVYGFHDGDTVMLRAGDRQVPVTVEISEAGFRGPLVTGATFEQLNPPLAGEKMWIRFSEDIPGNEEREAVAAAGARYGLEAVGVIAGRTNVFGLLNSFLSTLLGISIFIIFVALLGMMISTNMSVIERRREIQLIRSLGSDRGGVIKTFIAESLVISTVGAVTGMAVGSLFGATGTAALLGGEDLKPHIIIPWLWLTLIIIACIGLGTLSSWAASRNSAQGAPASN